VYLRELYAFLNIFLLLIKKRKRKRYNGRFPRHKLHVNIVLDFSKI